MPTNFTKFLIHVVICLGLVGFIGLEWPPMCLLQQAASAQETVKEGTAPDGKESEASRSADGLEQEIAEFEELVSAWRSTVGEINAATIRYRNSSTEKGREIRNQHRQLEIQGRDQFNAAFAKALQIAQRSKEADQEVIPFLLFATHYRYGRDLYEETGEAADALMQLLENERGLPEVAGVSYFATGKIDKARPFLQEAVEMGLLDEKNRGVLQSLDEAESDWEAERERVQKDAEKNDLPRVKLTTTRGDIVIELFEDEAPNTVANFISLVDEGAYRGVPFYQVLSAEVALAGDTRVGPDSVGFVIADENNVPSARPALRGYVCMAKLPTPEGSSVRTFPNSASSHFFICLRPLVEAKKEHTTFGRIIEGMQHCSVLTRVDPSKEKKEGEVEPDPDLILEAEVIRRRDHKYEPKRIDLAKVREQAQQAEAQSQQPQPQQP